MRFCDECSSWMRLSGTQYICSKCGYTIHIPRGSVDVVARQPPAVTPIHVLPQAELEASTVSRPCPRCGDPRAAYWVSASSGEHAGVKQERTLEHYRCTVCQHTWTESR